MVPCVCGRRLLLVVAGLISVVLSVTLVSAYVVWGGSTPPVGSGSHDAGRQPAAQPAPGETPAHQPGPGAAPNGERLTVEEFLKRHDLRVEGEPERFKVEVPKSWGVRLGEYPAGLYWGLANEFSRNVGLDLTPLKGREVEVWRGSLAGGLPGEGPQSQYRYPSNIVLLLDDGKVAGAWLTFNVMGIGPSVRMRNLNDITGLSFEEWVEREDYFSDAGKNADLMTLGPVDVVKAFFDAIQKGDRVRANACLSPRSHQNSLTVNLVPKRLYNPGFGHNNSLVENIVKCRLISWKFLDPQKPAVELKEVGDRNSIEVAAEVELKWRDAAFNTPTGRTTRFITLTRSNLGWKIEGMGTGP